MALEQETEIPTSEPEVTLDETATAKDSKADDEKHRQQQQQQQFQNYSG